MCKRFSFKASVEEIEGAFDIQVSNNLRWSYNIAPTQHAYVILNDSPKKLQYITWGLIPANSKSGKNEGKLINAVSSSFRLPIRSKRCLILADSFYTWHRKGQNEIPYRIALKDNQLIAMAGVWDIWYKGDYAIKSFSIITKPSLGELKDISLRMPVIIQNKKDQKDWLEDISLSRVQSILETKDPTDSFQYYEVSQELQSIQKNDSSLHKPA